MEVSDGNVSQALKRCLDPALLDSTEAGFFQPESNWSPDEAAPSWPSFGASPMMPIQQAASLGDHHPGETGTRPQVRDWPIQDQALPDDASKRRPQSPHQQDRSVRVVTRARSKQRSPSGATDSPPKRQRQSKSKEAGTEGGSVHADAEDATHRQGSLERNRIAASKCRKRMKKWVHDLEKRNSGLEKRHKDLQIEYLYLVQEISELKNYILGHASCRDPNIDTWLDNEASKYVCN
ncbi:transcription factor atf21 [Metarhizium album ARSEF 1941]|uniref:Transcription factor atf21 n=1 Tax=Metarhizium album (strain ARSEF 1941) TaxID=1081103 RepID=A0A0B2WKM9_METAS|nr:transcription factor atf21 [Metarhizium album ARSEF 1941]KHN94037.1 transcription factor atf21 [Metarhizium album ARSEF 1941]